MLPFTISLSWENIIVGLTMLSGWYVAFTARRGVEGDLVTKAVNAAAESIKMREKDIADLQEKLGYAEGYIDYLWIWINKNRGKKKTPVSFPDYRESKRSNGVSND